MANAIVTVNFKKKIGTSNLRVGGTHTQYSLDSWGDAASVAAGKLLARDSMYYHNQHIMGFGALSPEETQGVRVWGSLDDRVAIMRATTGVPVITFFGCPTWMFDFTWNGSTDWSRLETAPTTDRYDEFASLCAAAAARYPDVKYFQVWNELKGFYLDVSNRWDYENYTVMYNQIWDAVKAVRPDAKIGGPYIVIDNWADPGAGGHPATDATLHDQPWGTIDQRSLDVITYWLNNKHGADFIAIDASVNTREGTPQMTDDYLAGQQFINVLNWIRTQPNGGGTLPIGFAEWYGGRALTPQFTDQNRNNSLMANNLINTVKSGAAYALVWEVQGDSTGLAYPSGIFTDTRIVGGGQATSFYNAMVAFRDHFGPGVDYCETTVWPPTVSALASKQFVLLVNQEAIRKTVTLNGKGYNLNEYQVLEVPI